MSSSMQNAARRRFITWLGRSSCAAGAAGWAGATLAKLAGGDPVDAFGLIAERFDAVAQSAAQNAARDAALIDKPAASVTPITAPDQALNVFDFEAAARAALPPAHFGYLATGVDDDGTVRANREGFAGWRIRSRRLMGVPRLDPSVTLFGRTWETPIVLAPVSSQKAFHAEGEVAVARAAKAKRHLQILSTLTTAPIDEVCAARGEPVWFQLYTSDVWNITRELVKRAEAVGCPVLVLTVDTLGVSNRETQFRGERADARACAACHPPGVAGYLSRKMMYRGLDLTGVKTHRPPDDIGWDMVKRLKDLTRMPLVVKGIMTREDAELAIEHGVDGLFVSNHGGRSEESLHSTIDALPEVVEAARGRVPVLVDSGIRRGTDIFKALALGATAVCIGRPYVWGLGAFGQPGVEAVLDILRRELLTIMRQAGTTNVAAITPRHVARAR